MTNNTNNSENQLLLGVIFVCGALSLFLVSALRIADNKYFNQLWTDCTADLAQDGKSGKIVVSGRLLTYHEVTVKLPETFEFQKDCRQGVGSMLFNKVDIPSDSLKFTADGQVTVKPGKNEVVIVLNQDKKPIIFTGHTTTNIIVDGYVAIRLPTTFRQSW